MSDLASMLASAKAQGYKEGREDFGKDILYYCTELDIENDCLDHTENDDGEWVTMTIDYNKWAELWWFIEHGKKLDE